MNISDVDKNLSLKSSFSRKDIKIYNVCEPPFKIYGLIHPENDDDVFRRIPSKVAKSVSEGVNYLHTNTAGGRVRFKTDASYIAIKADMPFDKIGKMSHFSLAGSAGFDLYMEADDRQYYIYSFIPSMDIKHGFTSELLDVPYPCMREYTLNMPLYSDVSKLEIILNEGASLLPCREYSLNKPIVYYGSSITQGGCASRPGNSYQAIISRVLDCDYINLGFSGNAKGEREIAEYISTLNMSAFVYDYDYNAPNILHLEATHKPMFDIIRKANPALPVICVTRPVSVWYGNKDDENRRRDIITSTVNTAIAHGDKNVYLIDGADFASVSYMDDSLSVDGCHPNDIGFMCMAEVIGKKLRDILL